jgi:outer membrane cobalamin receptor
MKVLTALFLGLFYCSYAEEVLNLQDALISVSQKIDSQTSTGVTRSIKNRKSTPASISILNQNDLERFENIFDAINSLPGVAISQGYSSNIYINIRSTEYAGGNAHVLLMVNGLKLTDSASQQFILRTLPIRSIRKIELIRGPNSVLYGSGAYNGVISITTFDSQKYDKSLIETGLGTHSKRSMEFRHQEGNHMFSASIQNETNTLEDSAFFSVNGPMPGSRVNWNLDEYKSTHQENAFLGFSKMGNFDFTYGMGLLEDKNLYSLSGNTGSLTGEQIDSNRQIFIGSHYEHQISKQLAFKLFGRYMDSSDENSFSDGSGYTTTTDSKSYQIESQFFFTPNSNEEWLFGFSRELTDYAPTDSRNPGSSPAISLGINGYYLQNTRKLNSRLELLSSLRVDNHPIVGTHSIPRFALTYGVSQNDVLKIIHGKAYRDPNPRDLMNPSGRLDLEHVTSTEYIWERTYKKGTSSLSWFQNSYEEESDRPGFSGILSKRTSGLEAMLQYNPHKNLSTYVRHTKLRQHLSFTPETESANLFGAGYTWRFGESRKWNMDVDFYQFLASRASFGSNSSARNKICNIGFRFKKSANHQVKLYIQNAFGSSDEYLTLDTATFSTNFPVTSSGRRYIFSWMVHF